MSKNNMTFIKLLGWFLKEELRLHSTLFGFKRFMLFPFVIFIFSIIMGLAVPLFSLSISESIIIYSSIMILFGFQTGRMGFDAQDKIQNLLGESSRLIFSSKTLPIKQKKLIVALLVNDAIFYSILFLIPIFTGLVFGLFITPYESELFISSINILSVILMYLFTILLFIFGVSIGFVVTTNQLSKLNNFILLVFIPVGFYSIYKISDIELSQLFQLTFIIPLLVILTLVFILVGLEQFKVLQNREETKKYNNEFNKLKNFVSSDRLFMNIIFKTIIDIKRSAGGLWKVKFSSLSIILTSLVLIYTIDLFLQLSPKPEYLFGGLFSLIAYPIYTIVFRYDSIDSYSTLPISDGKIYQSKAITAIGFGIILSILYYVPVMIFLDVDLISILNGFVMLISLIVYQIGILLYLVKDEPIKFLFDGFYFAIYSFSVLIFIVPMLIVGMHGQILTDMFSHVVTLSILCGSVLGVVLIYTKSNN